MKKAFDCILVRYGEIALKSPYVRKVFEDTLTSNIKASLNLSGLDYGVKRVFGRILVDGYNKKAEVALKKVFGIVSFSPCVEIETDLNKIRSVAVKMSREWIKKSDSFAVRCNRHGTHDFNSKDIEISVGADIVDLTNAKVNLTKPDKTLGIDVRENKTYIYQDPIKGVGGIPLGTAGKSVSIIKDFNGVIASWLFMKRGCKIAPVFIGSAKKYLKTMEKWHIGPKLRPYFLKNFSSKELDDVLNDVKSKSIITGEVLGEKWLKLKHPVFRPLVGFDKKSLMRLRKTIES